MTSYYKKILILIAFFAILAVICLFFIKGKLDGKEAVIKQYVQENFSTKSSTNINWDGVVNISSSFSPVIEIKNIEISPNIKSTAIKFIEVKNIYLNPSFWQLISNDLQISSIKANGANIVLDSFSLPIEKVLFGYIRYLDDIAANNNIKDSLNINLANSVVSFSNEKIAFNANLMLDFASKDYEIEGDFEKEKVSYSFKLKIKHESDNKKQVKFTIKNNLVQFSGVGTLDLNGNFVFDAKSNIKISTKNALTFLKENFLKIDSDLKISENKIQFTNINSSSDGFTINGDVIFEKDSSLYANLNLNKLILDNVAVDENLLSTFKTKLENIADAFSSVKTNILVKILQFSVNKSAESEISFKIANEKNSKRKLDFVEINWPAFDTNIKLSTIFDSNLVFRLRFNSNKFKQFVETLKIDLNNRFIEVPQSLNISGDFVIGKDIFRVIQGFVATNNFEFGIKGDVFDKIKNSANFSINIKKADITNIPYKTKNPLLNEFKIISIIRELYARIKDVKIDVSAQNLNLYGEALTNFSANFYLKDTLAEFRNIAFTQNGLASSAEFILDFKDITPSLEGDISLNTINFAKLFENLDLFKEEKENKENKENKILGGISSIWNNDKFSIEKFTNLKTSVLVKANNINFGRANFTESSFTVKSDDKFFYLEKFKGKLFNDFYQISLTSTLEEVPSYTLTLNAPGSNLHNLLSNLLGIKNIYGNIGINLFANLKGNSLKEILVANAGNLKVALTDLVIQGYNVNSLVSALGKVAEKEDVVETSLGAIKTGNLNNNIGSFIANFPINQGKINFYRIQLPKHPAYSAVFNADLDLSTLSIDGEYLILIDALNTYITAKLSGKADKVNNVWDFSNLETFWLEKFLNRK